MKYSLFAGAAAALVSMVNAYTQPTGNLGGNPIYLPNIEHPVTVGAPYTITWDPTTEGTVTLVLLKGPAENVVPQFPIAETIANTGSYTWTPSADLVGQETGYGIQLIVDATGDYQYTTQFGVVNDKPAEEEEAPAASSAAAPVYGATESAAPVEDSASYTVSYATEYETKTDCDCTETPAPSAEVPVEVPAEVPSGVAYPTGVPAVPSHVPGTEYPGWNSTVPEVPTGPTGTGSVPVPSNPASVPSQPAYTGAAGQIKAGGFMMAVVAIVAVAMF